MMSSIATVFMLVLNVCVVLMLAGHLINKFTSKD